MRPSKTRARHARSIVGKIVLALAVASMLAGVSVTPAVGQDNDRRDFRQERFRRGHRPVRRGPQVVYRDYQPYGYYQESPPVVYAPPPVVYVPPPSPGISLFFGLPFGHRR